MRLPAPGAHYSQPVGYGGYVIRRLRRAKFLSMSTDAEKATSALLAAGRAWDDTESGIQGALADRDAIDDDLDDAAGNARASLAGRSATAAKEAPFTLIFPQGLGYYTAAPLDEETKRYGELKKRLEEHLPAGDPVRVDTVAIIDPNLPAYDGATKAVNEARTAQALARTKLDAARDAWDKQLEKICGALVAEVGKAKAERFFPKMRDAKKGKGEPG